MLILVKSIFPNVDSKGKRFSRTNRKFSVKNFMGPGISEAQADAAALEAAKAFHAELVEKGILSEPKQKDPNFTSEVPGVRWKKSAAKVAGTDRPKGWQEDDSRRLLHREGGGRGQGLGARRRRHGLQRQVKPVATLSELPVFHPKVPLPRGELGDQR